MRAREIFKKIIYLNQIMLDYEIRELYSRFDIKKTFEMIHIEGRCILFKPKGIGKPLPMLLSHLDTINDLEGSALCSLQEEVDFRQIMLIDEDYYNINASTNFVEKVYLKDDKDTTKVLGADDRAGVAIMLEMLMECNTNYIYGFFWDEESGGKGSDFLAKYTDCLDTLEISSFISLDRKGTNEVATYGYDNEDLIALFTNRGYIEQQGSFTDCVNLAEATGIACVNLSVGYFNEHTSHELQDMSVMEDVLTLLNDKELVEELTKEIYFYDLREEDELYYLNNWSHYENEDI